MTCSSCNFEKVDAAFFFLLKELSMLNFVLTYGPIAAMTISVIQACDCRLPVWNYMLLSQKVIGYIASPG